MCLDLVYVWASCICLGPRGQKKVSDLLMVVSQQGNVEPSLQLSAGCLKGVWSVHFWWIFIRPWFDDVTFLSVHPPIHLSIFILLFWLAIYIISSVIQTQNTFVTDHPPGQQHSVIIKPVKDSRSVVPGTEGGWGRRPWEATVHRFSLFKKVLCVWERDVEWWGCLEHQCGSMEWRRLHGMCFLLPIFT